jgi:hypothetical protein
MLRISRRTLFLATERNDYHAFAKTLRLEGWPPSVYLHTTCPGPVTGLAELFPCIPLPSCSLKLGTPTTGLASVVLLLSDTDRKRPSWWPRCDSLRLYGFGETNESAPYHYCSDGSFSDGHNSSEWYARTLKPGKILHDYPGEHFLLRANLSGTSSLDGPFNISRAAVIGWCSSAGLRLDIANHR